MMRFRIKNKFLRILLSPVMCVIYAVMLLVMTAFYWQMFVFKATARFLEKGCFWYEERDEQ